MISTVDMETGEILETKAEAESSNKRSRANRDFVQLYRQFIANVAELGMQNAQALRIYLFIIRHMDRRNALAIPQDIICSKLGLSRQTVSRQLKYLCSNGWLAILKLGRSNVYVVNPDIVWTSYDDEKAYCKFEATVMLDSADQDFDISGADGRQIHLKHIDRMTLDQMALEEFS